MAWPNCSLSIAANCLGRFHETRAKITPANDTALIANAAAGPDNATTTPPIAGPIARAAFPATLPKVEAAGICSRGTTSGWIACQAGPVSAAEQPMATVNHNSDVGLSRPRYVSTARASATSTAYD